MIVCAASLPDRARSDHISIERFTAIVVENSYSLTLDWSKTTLSVGELCRNLSLSFAEEF